MHTPHPFHWVPAGGQRHASADPLPASCHSYPAETTITALCGANLRAETSAEAWLWAGCADCRAATHEMSSTSPPATQSVQP